jgi:hypothetical protein
MDMGTKVLVLVWQAGLRTSIELVLVVSYMRIMTVDTVETQHATAPSVSCKCQMEIKG